MGLFHLLRRKLHPAAPPVWYHPRYRLPLAELEPRAGVELRRADLVAWHLADRRLVAETRFRVPTRISYADLSRVHGAQLLESLTDPETLARVFAVDAHHLPVDEVLDAVRLACGGTLAAAREALAASGPAVNLLGGFHHAAPDRGAGMCPVNDMAVALATLRAEGFSGEAAILDLDAHPPDGTAECLGEDPRVWLGSISGSDWGPLAGVKEILLPMGAEDDLYLSALDELLRAMPRAELTFVIAGGDVLAGDRLGQLGLTLGGVRRRDARVAEALAGRASVWLPGGGYTPQAWKVLSGTVLVLAGREGERIPDDYDPLRRRFGVVAASLPREALAGALELTEADVMEALGFGSGAPARFLGFYTREGIELALQRYGFLDHLQRLGYRDFRVDVSRGIGDRMRLFGRADGGEHLLIEADLARGMVAGRPVLFVHWLTLRHPLGAFGTRRPRLPGQEVPGLGLARETSELLERIAGRLGLDGVAFRPSWYHVAYAARSRLHFVDAGRQGRFEALLRDLADRTPLQATMAVADGRVRDGEVPYRWEADDMVVWLDGHRPDPAEVAGERERHHFHAE